MIAVSNTTPLRYLIAIDQEHLLGRVFEKVFVPTAVRDELTDSRTPEKVRHRIPSLPAWFEVKAVSEDPRPSLPVVLHRGERQAILLAEKIRPDVLLIDEQAGRAIAIGRNLPLSGTLGVLERADAMKLVNDYPRVLRELKAGGFFITEELEKLLLRRHQERLR